MALVGLAQDLECHAMPIPARIAVLSVTVLSLAACSPANESAADAQPANAAEPANPAPAFHSYDGWVGQWTGADGTILTVSPAGDGNYMLDMQSNLDSHVVYTAVPTAEGVEFSRGGQKLVLHEATGAQTGVSGLEGKQDCLMVARDEAFCRD